MVTLLGRGKPKGLPEARAEWQMPPGPSSRSRILRRLLTGQPTHLDLGRRSTSAATCNDYLAQWFEASIPPARPGAHKSCRPKDRRRCSPHQAAGSIPGSSRRRSARRAESRDGRDRALENRGPRGRESRPSAPIEPHGDPLWSPDWTGVLEGPSRRAPRGATRHRPAGPASPRKEASSCLRSAGTGRDPNGAPKGGQR